jgi:NarL family two-component system response regulator LiaR
VRNEQRKGKNMTSIVLIDDHPLVSNGIGAWLSATGRFSIAGTAENLTQARTLLEQLDMLPQIVVLDITLEKENGLAFISEIKKISEKRKAPVPRVLVCSMHEDPFLIQQAMELGADAYVAKSAGTGEILTAIDEIFAGKTYVNSKYRIKEQPPAFAVLTPREKEIIALRKQSLTNEQIAERQEISVRTVENHLAHIYSKTGVNSWEELNKLALSK